MLVLLAALAGSLTSCAKKGLVTEAFDEDFYRVETILEPGVHASNPRFIAYGDTQSGWRINEKFFRKENWWTWKALFFPFYYLYNFGHGAVGAIDWLRREPDYGGVERRLVRDAVYGEVVEEWPDFVVNLGDICLNDGRLPKHWRTFLEENRVDVPLLDKVAYIPVIGNHERANDEEYGYPNFRAVFDYPRFYVLDFPDLALFVIDSNLLVDQKHHIDDEEQDALFEKWFVAGPDAPQPGWLESELARRQQKFKIVMMHHPPVSIGRHNGDWTDSGHGNELPEKRRRLLNLFFEEGVQLVFSGHEHIYQHNVVRRRSDEGAGAAELHVLVTSGGGAPIRALYREKNVETARRAYLREGFIVDVAAQFETHHYSRVELNDNKLTVTTIAVEPGAEKPYPVLESITIEAD